MAPLRLLPVAAVLAVFLVACPSALADVEISRSGNTVTVEGSVVADDLLLNGTGSLFDIRSDNAQRIDAGAGCTSTGVFSGVCGSGVTTVNVDLRGGDDELRDDLPNNVGIGGGRDHDYTLSIDGDEGQDTIGPVDATGSWDGGAEDDTLQGGEQSQTLIGGADDDELLGGKDDDSLNGNGGNDTLDGELGADVMHGGSGNDALAGGGGEVLDGGVGGDAFTGLGAIVDYSDRGAPVTVTAGSGSGNDGNADDGAAGSRDTVGTGIEVVGTDFADTLTAAGGETVHGGDGNDTIAASGSNGATLLGEGDDDDITGGNGGDGIRGGPGDDDIEGGGANDNLFGDDGADELHGGSGADTANYTERTGGLTITLDALPNDGNSLDGPANARDLVDGATVEIVTGGTAVDTLTGDGNGNELRGQEGADVLNGGGGADRLLPGADGATMDGGPGADQFIGTVDTHDVVSYATRTAAVTVNVADGIDGNEGEPGEGDDLFGIEQVNGGAGDDAIRVSGATNAIFMTARGNGGNDTLAGAANQFGGEGNDNLSGRPDGQSVLNGDAGDDTFNIATGRAENVVGGGGLDTATYAAATQPVTVDLLAGTGGPAGEVDVFQPDVEGVTGSPFADTLKARNTTSVLVGGAGNDSLLGRDGGDKLVGGDGGDIVTGGAGEDRLDGGAGPDAMQALDGERDTVTCGTDVDTFATDAIDVLDASCETPPVDPGPGPGPGPGPAGTPDAPSTPPVVTPPPTGENPRVGPARPAAPLVRGFAASPKRVKAKGRAGFTFTTTQSGAARIRVERLDAGRRSGKRCVKPTKRLARAKRCDRLVAVSTLTTRVAKGAVKLALAKRLRPARYRATLTVTSAGLASQPVTTTFTVIAK